METYIKYYFNNFFQRKFRPNSVVCSISITYFSKEYNNILMINHDLPIALQKIQIAQRCRASEIRREQNKKHTF